MSLQRILIISLEGIHKLAHRAFLIKVNPAIISVTRHCHLVEVEYWINIRIAFNPTDWGQLQFSWIEFLVLNCFESNQVLLLLSDILSIQG